MMEGTGAEVLSKIYDNLQQPHYYTENIMSAPTTPRFHDRGVVMSAQGMGLYGA